MKKGLVLLMGCLFLSVQFVMAEIVSSKYKVEIYGLLKTDFMVSSHGTLVNNYRVYTTQAGRTGRSFRASARGTRLGFNISDGCSITGKIETDFIGLSESVVAGKAGTSSDLRLRHANINVNYDQVDLLVGQTWYLTTLEFPDTINDYFLRNSGNLWGRTPQMRLSFTTSGDTRLHAAVARPSAKLTDAAGTHAAQPAIQIKAETKVSGVKLSAAGSYGKWRNTTTDQYGDVDLMIAGFSVPFSSFKLNGVVWTGQNLSDYLGGLGNFGYGSTPVKASGGFIDLKIKSSPTLWFNIVYGVDNPKDQNIALNGRSKNTTVMGNVGYLLKEKVTVMLEVADLGTQYKLAAGSETRHSTNIQMGVKLPF